ncbi:MAG: P1 family peptidase, partial [Longimicrobiales bacterium]|nr:P1 family peptidase [Longimicrobiales bacterium]
MTLTTVPGIRVGHAEVAGGGSGCTVVLGPFRAAVEVGGMATGTRELGTLAPEHLVPQADAIVFAGGSAYGLAAAHGVMAWLAEGGQGYPTGADVVPIVPAAILYDLAEDRARPDASTGYAACGVATDEPVAEGRVGAGSGATVGKIGGTPMPGGVGSYALEVGGVRVGALAVVNAIGDVL